MNIYIVGFMGTGKTTVARLLAERLKREFIDLDSDIEKQEKMGIPDIFKKRGEVYFRSLEKSGLRKASEKKNAVVSCGGGAVIDRENVAVMKKTGMVVCLSASAEVIFRRTAQKKNRPLLEVADPQSRIKELLEERADYYARADKAVDTSSMSPEQVVDTIESFIPKE